MEHNTLNQIDLTRSLAMQERGKRCIPGLTQLLSKRPDQFAPGHWPAYFSKAKGSEVWDLDGNKYLDMSIGGIGANVLGYADDDVDNAVRAAIDNGISSSLNCPEEVELAELLCALHPWASKVRFSRCGGEATAMAIRIARAHTGRDRIAFCGYHGWHDWYLAANVGTKDSLGEHLIAGLKPNGVPQALAGTALPFRYNRLDELQQIMERNRGQMAAVIMEPIRNDPPAEGFLAGVRQLCNDNKAVLIIDEISAGFRMNSGGAHLQLDVTPDLAVFAKAIGNGYAISAVIGNEKVMESVQDTFMSSTNWTERIGPVAALATIRKHRDLNVWRKLMDIGTEIQAGWRNAAAENGLPIAVGGIPPMSHFHFELPEHLTLKALFVRRMLERGIMASTSCYSMFTHTQEDIHRYLQATTEVFSELAEIRRCGNLELQGIVPAVAGFKRLI